jgi:hypothetical protein
LLRKKTGGERVWLELVEIARGKGERKGRREDEPIEVRTLVAESDKELTAVGVRARVGHRKSTALFVFVWKAI